MKSPELGKREHSKNDEKQMILPDFESSTGSAKSKE